MLDVFFKEDIKNILRATLVASEGSANLIAQLVADDHDAARLVEMYRQGYGAALDSIALAFGVQPSSKSQTVTGELTCSIG